MYSILLYVLFWPYLVICPITANPSTQRQTTYKHKIHDIHDTRKRSVSETIRKPPLAKDQTTLRKQKKNKIGRKTIFNIADGILSRCNVARGSGVTCHCIPQNVRHIGILLLILISTISSQSTFHSAPVYEILSKSDRLQHKTNNVMSIFKMADAVTGLLSPLSYKHWYAEF